MHIAAHASCLMPVPQTYVDAAIFTFWENPKALMLYGIITLVIPITHLSFCSKIIWKGVCNKAFGMDNLFVSVYGLVNYFLRWLNLHNNVTQFQFIMTISLLIITWCSGTLRV